MKKLKKFNETNYNRDFKRLSDLKILLIEKTDLLNQLDVKNLNELEEYLLKSTGFKNIHMSATALGVEEEYKRILEIDTLTENEISVKDLTTEKDFKKAFLTKLKDKHSTFYSDIELSTLKRLNEVIELYNSLELEEKKQLAFNYNNLQISPFSYLKR